MEFIIRNRVTLVWLVLIAATVISWEMGQGVGFSDARYAGVTIIIVALIKVRLVILEFMEIRHAPRPMRWVVEIWVCAICSILLAMFWLAPFSFAESAAG